MISAREILKEYWNHDSFRAPQEQIIDAVLAKKDVIALLPTGGGKSVCFQIPALIKDGVCLVISPLIALMQDQVDNLKSKNIKATSIKSGATQDEIITLFDNIKFGKYKFLYISPERLQSTFIQQKLQELNISFVAIDEAHCISEWGHDFRPSYRNIKVLKDFIPDVNFIALTATANKLVLEDIANNLDLQKPIIFKKSFSRENLAYQIFKIEDKLSRLEQIFAKTKKPAIIYVTSRKKTEDIANFLNAKNYKSSFFHAGLSALEKQQSFSNWMSEKTPIMVATNAFGMGIDKANVGLVVHLDLPFSLENYIQEAGRAGRNEDKSFAVLLTNQNDVEYFKERLEKSLPSLLEVKEVHRKLYQYFRIAKGEIIEEVLGFNLLEFCEKYKFSPLKVDAIVHILANNAILEITSTYNQKSTIQFLIDSKSVIYYTKNNNYLDKFLNVLLRTYTGVFNQPIKIDEFLLAKKVGINSKQVIANLTKLHEENVLEYNTIAAEAEMRILVPREDDITINSVGKFIEQYIHQKRKKAKEFLRFVENNKVCRSIQILAYFDEISSKKCGICDVCLSHKKVTKKNISNDILLILKENESLTSQEIHQQVNANEKDILIHLQRLIADEKVIINRQNKYKIQL